MLLTRKEIYSKIKKALSVKLPENPITEEEHRYGRRRRRMRRAVNVAKLPRLKPLYYSTVSVCSESLILRIAAWCVYCCNIEEIKPFAVKRLKALLAWKEWLAIWREPKKMIQSIKKQIRQLER